MGRRPPAVPGAAARGRRGTSGSPLVWDALARRLSDGLAAGRAVDPEVAFARRRMEATRGQVRVDALASETGWGRTRLWSRFRSQIGITPKRAAQLVRFDHAAHRLAAGHGAARVAAEAGYADQSHPHRDVVAFAGGDADGRRRRAVAGGGRRGLG